MTPRDARSSLRSVLLALSTSLFVGCSGAGEGDTSIDLPEDDTAPADTGEPWEFVDTGGGDTLDDVPLDTLTLREWGSLLLSPTGGPYTGLSGELRVQEYENGVRPDTADTDAEPVVLACDVVYTVAGVPFAGTPCDGCSPTFRVEFSLISGNPSLCHDPELPDNEDQWTLGWRDGDDELVKDWGDAGLWQHWAPGLLESDTVTFLWEVTVGVALEEEEE